MKNWEDKRRGRRQKSQTRRSTVSKKMARKERHDEEGTQSDSSCGLLTNIVLSQTENHSLCLHHPTHSLDPQTQKKLSRVKELIAQ
jgi:hypothetical protein